MANNKKVILVSGKGSNWYEQAIFIINEDCKKMPMDMVKEAENIIKKYIELDINKKNESFTAYKKNMPMKKTKAKRNNNEKVNTILNIAITLCLVMVCFLIYLVFKL